MAYCTLDDIRAVLPQNITIGTSTVPTVQAARANSISVKVANQYIYFATQFIDSRLCQLYYTPLIQIKKMTVDLIHNMLPSSTDVMVSNNAGFFAGATVMIKDDNGSELAMITDISETVVENTATVKNFNHITLSQPTQNAYDAGSHGEVSLLIYSDPIPIMTARLASALMFDKLFVADQHPDVSNYGKALRNMAITDMNAILTGQVRLEGQEFCSRRFVRTQLYDAVKLAIDGLTLDQGLDRG